MSELFKEVDFVCTRTKSTDILRQYRKWDRIAGRASIDIRSPKISDMPKSPNYCNKTEDAIIQHMDAEMERNDIIKAIKSLDLVRRQLLFYMFCDQERYSNALIADRLGYSERQLNRLKKEALLMFAESYKRGKLISYY